jgi:hypothetical protein
MRRNRMVSPVVRAASLPPAIDRTGYDDGIEVGTFGLAHATTG